MKTTNSSEEINLQMLIITKMFSILDTDAVLSTKNSKIQFLENEWPQRRN